MEKIYVIEMNAGEQFFLIKEENNRLKRTGKQSKGE